MCVTQITSWGVVYYAFSAPLQITWASGSSVELATAASTAAQLVSAFVGICVGRTIDHQGRTL
ncbi:hypothetical protein ACFXMT_22760 [Streptomyces mirabilis]|uniref:hypothetical protein n=1 Tax=Streptomyces mirabilis TaxID=68239 RepID=UPI00365353A4